MDETAMLRSDYTVNEYIISRRITYTHSWCQLLRATIVMLDASHPNDDLEGFKQTILHFGTNSLDLLFRLDDTLREISGAAQRKVIELRYDMHKRWARRSNKADEAQKAICKTKDPAKRDRLYQEFSMMLHSYLQWDVSEMIVLTSMQNCLMEVFLGDQDFIAACYVNPLITIDSEEEMNEVLQKWIEYAPVHKLASLGQG